MYTVLSIMLWKIYDTQFKIILRWTARVVQSPLDLILVYNISERFSIYIACPSDLSLKNLKPLKT